MMLLVVRCLPSGSCQQGDQGLDAMHMCWFCWFMCLSLVFVGWFLSLRPWQQCQDSPVGRSFVAFDAQLRWRTPSCHHRTTPSRIERPWQVPSFGRAGPDRKPVLRLYLRRSSSIRVLCCEMHSSKIPVFSALHTSHRLCRAECEPEHRRSWVESENKVLGKIVSEWVQRFRVFSQICPHL